jgi:hypothetical protein
MKKIKKKVNAKSNISVNAPPQALTWMNEEGIHVVTPGSRPSAAQLDEMTRTYQESIRNSPMWEEMVRTFGKKKAEELLLQCCAKLA